jgi:hypothetical protein
MRMNDTPRSVADEEQRLVGVVGEAGPDRRLTSNATSRAAPARPGRQRGFRARDAAELDGIR